MLKPPSKPQAKSRNQWKVVVSRVSLKTNSRLCIAFIFCRFSVLHFRPLIFISISCAIYNLLHFANLLLQAIWLMIVGKQKPKSLYRCTLQFFSSIFTCKKECQIVLSSFAQTIDIYVFCSSNCGAAISAEYFPFYGRNLIRKSFVFINKHASNSEFRRSLIIHPHCTCTYKPFTVCISWWWLIII
jgi:hypothetical protein